MQYELENTRELHGTESAGDLIMAGETMQQIKTAYATAVQVQKPRILKDVLRRCVEEAELAGDEFYYRWPISSKDRKTGGVTKGFVEGPSINLALAAVRNFGNMVVQQLPVQETSNSYIFTAALVDLETGFTLERQFRMSKDFPVYGKMDRFRKDDIKFQVGQSKAIRNVVLNGIPSGLISKMIGAAKGSIKKQIEAKVLRIGDIQKVIDEMLAAFEKHGVTEGMVEDKVNLKRKSWDIETLTLLSGDLKALVSGAETADSLYAEDEPEPEVAENGLAGTAMKPGDPGEHQDIRTGEAAGDGKKKDKKKQGKLGEDF